MQFKDILKRFISHGAIVYTCGSISIISISLILSNTDSLKMLDPHLFLLFALFSFVISLGSTLFCSGLFSPPISRLIHAVCYIGGFFAFLLLYGMKFSFAMIFALIFAVIYLLVSAIVFFIKKGNKKTKAQKEKQPVKNAVEKPQKKAKQEQTYTNRFS